MSHFERQVHVARRRIWLNGWMSRVFWCLCGAAVGFAGLTVTQRLTEAAIPLGLSAAALAAVAVLASLIWSLAERRSLESAAAALDEAAGLRERLSSSLYCRASDDPFSQAVVSDAERASSAVSARRHIRFTYPRSANYAAGASLAASLSLLVPAGLLGGEKKPADPVQVAAVEQVQATVKKQFQEIIRKAEDNPALEELKEEMERLAEAPDAPLDKPDAIRHEAQKKIDSLADAVKDKLDDPGYDKVEQMQKMMRGLKVPQEADTPANELSKSLAEGDFKEAQEQIEKLQEQLATLKHDEDKEMAEQLSKQLEDLSKQLEQLAQNKDLEQKLQQAGIKPEDLQRMLENLSKQDLDQVKKSLEQQGYNQQQIEQMAKQLAQRQSASQGMKQLSQAMKQASQCNSPGSMSEAAAGLSAASDQLSELEQLQTEMDQLNSTLSDLQNAKDSMNSCSQCQGTGQCNGGKCSGCNGSGQCQGGGKQGNGGMGQKPGQGRGGLAEEQQTAVAFKTERQKVETRKGAIIGQFLIDGEQVKGQASKALAEIVTAEEREATDAVTRDRIPRQYQKSVKAFFSTVQKALEGQKAADGEDDKTEEAAPVKKSDYEEKSDGDS